VIVQVPALTSVAMPAATVQTFGVAELKLTARPELAVAVSASAAPTFWLAMGAKAMLCARPATAKDCVTGEATA